MKRLFILYIFLLLFCLLPFSVFGETKTENMAGKKEKIDFVLFHLNTCPHCQDEIKFIQKKIIPDYGAYLDFKMYEMNDPASQTMYEQYVYYYKLDNTGGVPLAIIDGEVVNGYGSDKTTGKQIFDIVEKKLEEKGLIKINEEKTEVEGSITLPLVGNIDPKTFSLPLLTVIIGLLDGFNPCAMWVLLFLISLLLGMENKKRMWILGGLFVVSSGLVYFLFMAAWLQFLMFVGMIFAIRVLIGLVAVGVGGWNLRDYWKNRKADGVVCKVSKQEKTKKTFDRIKDIVYSKSMLWSIVGILILGFSVNLVELACSAGFPAIFTQVLALNDLPLWQKYLYMTGYIFFYMLDDMIVFIIAMITLKSKIMGGKYAKYANLVGGLLILILGLLLIFKPDWLMFG